MQIIVLNDSCPSKYKTQKQAVDKWIASFTAIPITGRQYQRCPVRREYVQIQLAPKVKPKGWTNALAVNAPNCTTVALIWRFIWLKHFMFRFKRYLLDL